MSDKLYLEVHDLAFCPHCEATRDWPSQQQQRWNCYFCAATGREPIPITEFYSPEILMQIAVSNLQDKIDNRRKKESK
jgi:hypothetical protein